MTIDNNLPIDPLAPASNNNAPTQATEDSAGFRRLLETLERLAKENRKAPTIADASGVQDAVAKADEGFTLAMDLRRQLENAFRQRMP